MRLDFGYPSRGDEDTFLNVGKGTNFISSDQTQTIVGVVSEKRRILVTEFYKLTFLIAKRNKKD